MIYRLFTFVELPPDSVHFFFKLAYFTFVLLGDIFDLIDEHTKAFKYALSLMTFKDL